MNDFEGVAKCIHWFISTLAKKKKQTNLVLDFPASGRHILEKLDTIEKEALTCANIQHESP